MVYSEEKITETKRGFKDLLVWQRSIKLVDSIYELTKTFPKEEVFGLISQIRRSAISVPSNIAEGSRRGTKKDFRQFLFIALGSLSELETQIIISINLGYTKESSAKIIQEEIEVISKMLSKLIKSQS